MNMLFDLDGTIGNTLPLCIEAFRATIEPLANRSLSDEEIIAQFGPSEEGMIKALIPDHFEEGVKRYLAYYERLHGKSPTPFDGIADILTLLKERGCYVGLATGKGPHSTRITLDVYQLTGLFDCIKTGSIHGPVKRQRIEEVLEETGMPRSDFFYVGDSPSDVEDAKACRIKSVAAAWAPTSNRRALQSTQPDFLFDSIQEFREFIENSLQNG